MFAWGRQQFKVHGAGYAANSYFVCVVAHEVPTGERALAGNSAMSMLRMAGRRVHEYIEIAYAVRKVIVTRAIQLLMFGYGKYTESQTKRVWH